MHFDVSRHVGAVSRKVAGGERDGRPTRIVIAARSIAAPVDDVWEALTDAVRIPRWFLPISGDLRLGGHYQLEGNAGGTIAACAPPSRLALTWEFGGSTSWVNLALVAESVASTWLELEHSALVDEQFLQFWNQFGPGAVGVGWDLSLLGLAEHLERGFAAAPEDNAAWLASANGREFVAGSSEGWRAASVAFGSDGEAARQAADRTTAAYTAG
jgi:uncharacterized protein YndB with AHSA1/START domain